MLPDPLFDKLRALSPITPDRVLTERVANAALTALAGDPEGKPDPSLVIPSWRTYLEFAVYRAAVPSVLAGATILYLSWAVSAASHLY